MSWCSKCPSLGQEIFSCRIVNPLVGFHHKPHAPCQIKTGWTAPYWLQGAQLKSSSCCPIRYDGLSHGRKQPLANMAGCHVVVVDTRSWLCTTEGCLVGLRVQIYPRGLLLIPFSWLDMAARQRGSFLLLDELPSKAKESHLPKATCFKAPDQINPPSELGVMIRCPNCGVSKKPLLRNKYQLAYKNDVRKKLTSFFNKGFCLSNDLHLDNNCDVLTTYCRSSSGNSVCDPAL